MNDGVLDSNVVAVTITVNPVNDAPVALNDAYSTDEDIALSVGVKGVLANDTDVDARRAPDGAAGHAAGQGTLGLNSDGSFTYVPNRDFSGTDTFAYKANDGSARLQHRHGVDRRQRR